TYDGATLRMFVNGVQVASRAHAGTMTPSTGVLRIGGTNVASEWFAGRIDDLRIYARALSASEIQLDMAAGIP
ncbi:MAG: LamG domain-containing protein, partial [Gaiellaceae bacterium]